MKKCGSENSVKKVFVRNAQKNIQNAQKSLSIPSNSRSETTLPFNKQNDLAKPTLCSSEILSNYIRDVKKSLPSPVSSADVISNKSTYNAKITKQLNFHMNDKLFKNLVELNDNIDFNKKKKEKKPSNSCSVKKDLEPNIDDFFQDEEKGEKDVPPKIVVMKPKFKPRKEIENGDLHKLVSAFDIL